MRFCLRPLALGFLLLCLGREATGQGPNVGRPSRLSSVCDGKEAVLDITAARMTFDRQKHSFLFEEKVQMQQCGMMLHCDRLEVSRDETSETIGHAIARGHVHVQLGTRQASAEQAEYFETSRRLVLTGNPRVWDTTEQHEMMGEEIVILLRQEHMTVRQARVLFHTPSKRLPKAQE